MKSVRQVDMVTVVARRTHITKNTVKKVLEGVTSVFCDAVEEGLSVCLGFGSFEPHIRPIKPAYDFKKKRKILLPPKNKVVFTPSLKVRRLLAMKEAQMTFDFAKEDAEKNNG